MSFRDMVKADAKEVFLNLDEHGEPATYIEEKTKTEKIIAVIPTIGATLEQGNLVNNEGTSDRAVFALAIEDISDPKANDKIIHNGITWTVVRIAGADFAMCRVECTSGASPFKWR